MIKERVATAAQTPIILASGDERIGDTRTEASWKLRALVASPFAACVLRVARTRHGREFRWEEPDTYGWRLVLEWSGKRGGREAFVTLNVTSPRGYTCSCTLGSVCVDNISRQTVLRALREDANSPLSPFARQIEDIVAEALRLP